jgi:hydrogenase expression/formation protein HypE
VSASIDLRLGAGGKASHDFYQRYLLTAFANSYLDSGQDQAILPPINQRLAFTTDSYVVSPCIFPGGDIGTLAVNGTINDILVGKAVPLYLSLSFIIEEGLQLALLQQIIASIKVAAHANCVQIVTGDTKVVPRGQLYVNTSGIGYIPDYCRQTIGDIQIGDCIIISGTIGDHGMAILAQRDGIDFSGSMTSDCASLAPLLLPIIQDATLINAIRLMRDPTRGGVAGVLHEWCSYCHISVNIMEQCLPVKASVRAFSELLGLEPLHVANEGKVMLICAADMADEVVNSLQQHPLGIDASIIGTVTACNVAQPLVGLTTSYGSIRRLEWLDMEQLPRIC